MNKLLAITCLIGCAAAPPVQESNPRGLRASDHLAMARQEDEAERRAWMFPDTRSASPTDPPVETWQRRWDPDEHGRLATMHRARAAEIEAGFAEACAPFQTWEMGLSPIVRYGLGGWNTATGVIIYLSPDAGDAERLLSLLRCHRSWMMLGRSDMEDCPLDLPGIMLDARGSSDGITISIVARDAAQVPELQRRATLDLENARRARSR